MKTSLLILSTGCALLLIVGHPARAGQVSETEAVALAEWWYANEIRAKTTGLPLTEKQERLANKSRHQVQYLLGRENLQHGRKGADPVLAFVVTFEPSGFVVIAGDDALQPVLAFNATGHFRWDSPQKSFLSHFLGRCVAGAVQHHRASTPERANSTHKNWSGLRDRMKTVTLPPAASAISPSSSADESASGTYVLLPTPLWDQGAHYNEVCVNHNGGIDVPTGCTATAMAIKFRYHEWPKQGKGSHSYADSKDSLRFSHSVDFSKHSYNWSAMPTSSLTAYNAEVAQLMYDCGVAVEMNYETNGSGAWPTMKAMADYFDYRDTMEISSTVASDHVEDMAYSIRCGLPVILSTVSHTMVACGYRDSIAPYFYINTGWDGSGNSWYNLDQLPPVLGTNVDHVINVSLPYSCPKNYTYVDSTFAGPGFGTLGFPYNDLYEGSVRASEGGTLMLKAGNYITATAGTITIARALTLKSYLGTAVIGN